MTIKPYSFRELRNLENDTKRNIMELDLSAVDTSGQANMNHLFSHSEKIRTLDLSSFDTSGVVSMSAMFRDCTSLEQLDLSHFDFSQVKSMNDLFMGCHKLKRVIVSDTILNAPYSVDQPTGKMIEKLVPRSESEMEPVYVYGAQSRSQVYAYSDPYKYIREPEMKQVRFGKLSRQEQRKALGLDEKTELIIVAHVCRKK